MNHTNHGRWGRYRSIGGVLHKLCNGPLHEEGGEWMPMRAYWIMKKGPRKGKPISRCQACEKVYRGRDPQLSGLVPVNRVWFVFQELDYRIGRAETCRRLGISVNLWYRLDNRVYQSMYRKTARDAMLLLHDLRDNNIARHRDSIKHGASMRGHKEKIPTKRIHFNGKDETANERRRQNRRLHSSST